MIQLSWSAINQMANVINTLAHNGKVDRVVSYRAARIMNSLKSKAKDMHAAREAIWLKFCDYEGEGDAKKPLRDENGQLKFSDESKVKECMAAVDELFNKELVEVPIYKLPFDGVKDHLPGGDIIAIEEILEGVPEIA